MPNILTRTLFVETLLALRRPKSFNELLRELRASPDTVSRRLRDLKGYGLVEPIVVSEEGRSRLKYALTREGSELLPLVERLASLLEEIETRLERGQRNGAGRPSRAFSRISRGRE